MLDRTSPARKGADLLVGTVVFIIVLPMLWNAKFGEEVTHAAVQAVAPESFVAMVENQREARFLEANGVDSGSLRSVSGGFTTSVLNFVAVVMDTGLPTVVNVVSAVGAAATFVFLLGKTFVIFVVQQLIDFTRERMTEPKKVVQVDGSGETVDVAFLLEVVEDISNDQAEIGSDWAKIQKRFSAHETAIKMVNSKHQELAKRMDAAIPKAEPDVKADGETGAEPVKADPAAKGEKEVEPKADPVSEKLDALLKLMAEQKEQAKTPTRRTRTTKKTEAAK